MSGQLPETMDACVLTSPGEFEIRRVSLPQFSNNEVLCKIHSVAICGSDPEVIHGELAGYWPPSYPFIVGHEWAGEVVAVGKNITSFKVGDRVAGEAHNGCGSCENCMRGRYNICINYGKNEMGHRHYGFTAQGAYAQYNAYFPKALTLMPDNVTYDEGAMCDPAGVSMHGAERMGITPGGTVVVIGPGPIGLTAMRAARAKGAAKVIVVGRPGVRLEAAKRLGADHIVDGTKPAAIETVRSLTNNIGADEAFECSGAIGTITQAAYMLRRGGSICLLGAPPEEASEPIPTRYITYNEITIFGSKANPNSSKTVLELMSTGQMPVKDLVTHVFPLSEFAEALETFETRKGNAVKVVIHPHP